MTGVELATLCLTKSTPPSPPTVEADRIPELLGEIERRRAIPVAFVRGTHYSSRGVTLDDKNGHNCACVARGGS